MDQYWKKKLDEDFIGSRIEGAFDRANRGSLNEKFSVSPNRKESWEVLAGIMSKAKDAARRKEALTQMRDYLHDHYNSQDPAVANEELQAALDEFGEKSKNHFHAKKILEGLLVSNSGRTDHTGSQLLSGPFGSSAPAGLFVAEKYANDESLPLALEFLGLKLQSDAENEDAQSPLHQRESAKTNPNAQMQTRAVLFDKTAMNLQKGLMRSPDFGSDFGGVEPRLAEEIGRIQQAEPSREIEKTIAPIPNGTGTGSKRNPFALDKPDLEKQSRLIERNPLRAKQLILAAGRDPSAFGFA